MTSENRDELSVSQHGYVQCHACFKK